MNPESEYFLERELAFLYAGQDELARYFARQYPGEAGFAPAFAERYPAAAGQLIRMPEQSTDPHAERMIQGFAFLGGRVQKKIGDEFPNVTESLLQILYPHLLRPVPSMSVAQFSADWSAVPPSPGADARGSAAGGIHVPAGSTLLSRPVGVPPTPCPWRTGYAVGLWPVTVEEASLAHPIEIKGLDLPPRTASVLRLQLRCAEPFRFDALTLDHLRFYLDGPLPLMSALYELLFNHATRIVFRDPERPEAFAPLECSPAECLAQVGFELDEGLLPFPLESFVGYRLLTELFTYPNKFLFFDLKNLGLVSRAGAGRRIQVLVAFNNTVDELARGINAQMFQLGCTPVINVYEKVADPIALTHTRSQYLIVPDRASPKGVEVFSVDSVSTFDPDGAKLREYEPFYSYVLGEDRGNTRKAFWYAARRDPPRAGGRASEVYLVLVDPDFDPRLPAEQSVNIHVTCLNGDLPAKLLRAGSELALREAPPFPGTIRFRHAPTFSRRPVLNWGTLSPFLTQSALNHVPLSDPTYGLEALKETLRLCTGGPVEGPPAAVMRQMIDGVTALTSQRVARPVRHGRRVGACHGMEITLELDRQKYVSVGTFLFACVLERFLGLYASVNSFSQLLVRTTQGKGYLKKWPPRSAGLLVQ